MAYRKWTLKEVKERWGHHPNFEIVSVDRVQIIFTTDYKDHPNRQYLCVAHNQPERLNDSTSKEDAIV